MRMFNTSQKGGGGRKSNSRKQDGVCSTHHSHSRTHGLWGKVMLELCPHDPAVAMRPHDAAPDHAILGRFLLTSLLRLTVSSIYIGHSLPEIERGFLSLAHSFQLEQRCVRLLVMQAPLVPHKYPLGV